MKKFLFVVIVLAIAGGVWYWRSGKARNSAAANGQKLYRCSPISKQTITQEVSATGTVKAIQEVEVGTQVTGKIVKLLADYNSKVTAGQVVARIDPLVYESSYAAAKANLASANANLAKTKASLALAEKELKRNEALVGKKMISVSDYDTSVATRDELKAQMLANQASIEQATANLKQAKTNLDYCTIVSPVTGVVLKRDVDEGQTVVSNMNASTLFTIATDLSKIWVEASIPEADIGQVHVGQTVNFTVDAYRQKFKGVVKQVRMAATTSSNVVTYPVIVEAENPGGKLFPGMTATLSVIVASADDVWAVPTAALRFKPTDQTAPKDGRYIWIAKSPSHIEPLKVKMGVTDSVYQQITAEVSLEGLQVATGIMTAAERENAEQVNNPFMMRPPGAGKNGKRQQGPPPPMH